MDALSDGLLWMPHVHWGLMIAIYLFLGGVAGGSYLTGYTAAILNYVGAGNGERRVRTETVRWGMLAGLVSIAVGTGALLSHLGGPTRAFLFPVLFTNYGSWITLGTWIIVLFSMVTLVQTVWYTFGDRWAAAEGASLFPRRIVAEFDSLLGVDLLDRLDSIADATRPGRTIHLAVGAIGVVFGVGVMVYTGLLLSDLWTVPLWDAQVLPVLFLVSGISTGISATILLTVAFEGLSETVHQFSLADDALILAELGVIWVLISSLEGGGAAATRTLHELNAEFGLLFWGGIVAAGLVVPVVLSLAMTGICYRGIDSLSRSRRRLVAAGFAGKYALVLFGGFLLRAVVLFAAVKNPVGLATVGF